MQKIIVTHWTYRGALKSLLQCFLFNKVEEAYESKVEAKEYMEAYRAFKKIVPSIGEEKRLGREFEEVSGYSLYRATQAAKQKEEGWFSLEE